MKKNTEAPGVEAPPGLWKESTEPGIVVPGEDAGNEGEEQNRKRIGYFFLT